MSSFKHIGIVSVTAVGAALCYKEIVTKSISRYNRSPEISMHAHPQNEYITDDFSYLTNLLLESVEIVKNSGAEFAVIPANTAHYVFDEVQENSSIPLLNIIDLTVEECVKNDIRKVSVLGTFPTMQFSLYREKLKEAGIQLVEPNEVEKGTIDTIISDELLIGRLNERATKIILSIINRLKNKGSEKVILACTELPLLINNFNSPLPCIDTTELLAQKALSCSVHDSFKHEIKNKNETYQREETIENISHERETVVDKIVELPKGKYSIVEKGVERCKEYLTQKSYKRGKEIMEEVVKEVPESCEAHAWLAISIGRLMENTGVLQKMRLLPQFEREILKALEISPNSLLARKVNGMRLLNTPEGFGGNINKAIDEFNFCLTNGLQDDELYYSLGQAYMKVKKVEEGKEAFQSTLHYNPDHKMAKRHLDIIEKT
ncbi:amino acid racemase [Halobacillus sp. HZG1]|uniref:amino acid racemase n=1 Tax=Halobacillus sp. HZG1 TaxID=3111769 RepID=UPI002DBD38E6|nr:amino acid racemase [Halobacillus sp. HZG1]MEC3885146.1 amino acid racemase [Halobacillus sp. HZG1]